MLIEDGVKPVGDEVRAVALGKVVDTGPELFLIIPLTYKWRFPYSSIGAHIPIRIRVTVGICHHGRSRNNGANQYCQYFLFHDCSTMIRIVKER